MLEKFLVLLERFVVAHELIAKTNAERGVLIQGHFEAPLAKQKELPVEGENVIDTPAVEAKPKRTRGESLKVAAEATKKKVAKPAPEPEADDLADDEPEEKKPAKKEVDLTPLRDEIKQIAKHIAAGESDKCADLFDELLEDYGVRTVTKLPDEDVVKFHTEAKTLVAKYYDVEED